MIGDCNAQLAAAARIAVVQVLGTEGAHAPADESAKALHRALVDMGAAEREGALLGRLDNHLLLLRCGGARRDPRSDEGAGTDGRFRKPVGDQALVSRDDRVTPKASLLCQRARRRQRLAGFDQAGDDHLAQRLVQPVRRGGAGGDVRAGEIER